MLHAGGDAAMKHFTLELCDARTSERIDEVESFVGEDASGSFGMLAGREHFVTVLVWGICRYRTNDGRWHDVALPGGVLSFFEGTLTIYTHHFLQSDDVAELEKRLDAEIAAEEFARRAISDLIHRMDRELLRQMIRLD